MDMDMEDLHAVAANNSLALHYVLVIRSQTRFVCLKRCRERAAMASTVNAHIRSQSHNTTHIVLPVARAAHNSHAVHATQNAFVVVDGPVPPSVRFCLPTPTDRIFCRCPHAVPSKSEIVEKKARNTECSTSYSVPFAYSEIIKFFEDFVKHSCLSARESQNLYGLSVVTEANK